MNTEPHDNGAATDLDHLLGGLHEKNPQALLGDLNKSELPKNVVLAAVITFAGLTVLSLVPALFSMAGGLFAGSSKPEADGEPTKAAAKVEPAKKEQPKETVKTNPDPLEKSVPDPLATKPPKGPDPLEKLGVSETKSSDPKKNPLDKSVDDLLKDIK